MAARAAKTAATGKKPGGKAPQPPPEGPLPSDQVNLTDDDFAHHAGGRRRLHQCYNAQAAVAVGSLLVVATEVVQAPNDKNQVEPMLGKIGALPEALGEAETLLAAISVRAMSRLAKRRELNRRSRWAASRTIRLWPSAKSRWLLRTIRRGSRRWRIV